MSGIYLSALRRLEPGGIFPYLPPAELLVVTSSAEVGILAAPACWPWLAALSRTSPAAPVHFVSIGCAGVAACVLEFSQSGAQLAHVLVVESPAEWVQSTLDAAGVGQGGDGFQAQDVAYLFTLRRGLDAGTHGDELPLLHCSLLSREAGMAGTAQLASRFVGLWRALLQCHGNLRMVTFENCSRWSSHLGNLVDVLARAQGMPGRAEWLPSREDDLRHYMTARPLLDLEAYDVRSERPLMLPCLGAGGRLGLLVVGGAGWPAPECSLPAVEPLDLPVPASSWLALPQGLPCSVLYAQREYFGRSQFYFRWKLTHEHFSHPQAHVSGTAPRFRLSPVGTA